MTATLPSLDPSILANSRDYCRDLTRREARNFYYGLKLLPEPKRSSMYALYAYMRLVDDIADDDSHGRTVAHRRADLDQWQSLTHQAINNPTDVPKSHIVWPAFADLVQSYSIPLQLFDDMIEGQRQDLNPAPFPTFRDLHAYCYRVASVVGIASLYVWGFREARPGERATRDLAVDRGIAFQLTNILRDLREDAARGRCYLPAEDFSRFSINAENLAHDSPALAEFLTFQAARAQAYYDASAPLDERVAENARPTLRAMTSIYHGLLKKIAKSPTIVLRKRVRLSALTKLFIAYRAMRS